MEILKPGFHYHIYNRGNNKETLFLNHEDYIYFLHLYLRYIHPIADTFCYCLMPNHFHFLIQLKEKEEILSLDTREKPSFQHFSNYFNAYAKYINRKYGRTGSLFQERYRRKLVNDEVYLKQLIHYIHTNPVHHGITDNFQGYQYSSYNRLIKNNPTILMRERVINYFDSIENYEYVHKKQAQLTLIKNLIKGDEE